MPSTFKSPYATSFRTAIKRGTPCSIAVKNIAKRTGKTPSSIFQSLHKADMCFRQKFNGQWIYWPCEDIKVSATQAKESQIEMWQCFVDWCIVSGKCKPEQMWNNTGTQQDFMTWCRKHFSKQFVTTNGKAKRTTTKKKARTTSSRKRTTATSRSRNTTTGTRRKTTSRKSSRSYSFPTAKSRVSKRYRNAA